MEEIPLTAWLKIASVSSSEEFRSEAVCYLVEQEAEAVYDCVAELLKHGNNSERAFACITLGELSVVHCRMAENCLRLLKIHAGPIEEQNVRSSAIRAMGQSKDDLAIDEIIRYADDSNPGVRLAVAQSLYAASSDRACLQLVQLSADDDQEVREWSVFKLRNSTPSTHGTVCRALLDRLADVDEVKLEAMRALVYQGEFWVLELVAKQLDGLDVDERLADAVAEVARKAEEKGSDILCLEPPVLPA